VAKHWSCHSDKPIDLVENFVTTAHAAVTGRETAPAI
jgi:hypothetical protein